jgi:hypothetical protein
LRPDAEKTKKAFQIAGCREIIPLPEASGVKEQHQTATKNACCQIGTIARQSADRTRHISQAPLTPPAYGRLTRRRYFTNSFLRRGARRARWSRASITKTTPSACGGHPSRGWELFSSKRGKFCAPMLPRAARRGNPYGGLGCFGAFLRVLKTIGHRDTEKGESRFRVSLCLCVSVVDGSVVDGFSWGNDDSGGFARLRHVFDDSVSDKFVRPTILRRLPCLLPTVTKSSSLR